MTSIGEPTTRLCCEQLLKYGLELVLLKDSSSLWYKLSEIYRMADDDFLRVDADVIPNRNIKDFWYTFSRGVWWVQGSVYEWWRQDVSQGGVQFIRKEAIPHLREAVGRFSDADRPETQLSRIPAFYEPRRFETSPVVSGLHGYGQDDLERVKAIKKRRKQLGNYDFELVEKLNGLRAS